MRYYLKHHFIYQLRKSADAKSRLEALRVCSQLPINNPVVLKEYHDKLLFLCAYPENIRIRELALAELGRLSQIVKQREDFRWQHTLSGSGLPYTELRCQYSRSLSKWILERFPGQVAPAESAAKADTVKQTFQMLLPGIEFERSTHGDLNTWSRIKLLSGHYFNPAALKWLLDMIDQKDLSELIKDQLYDNLEIYLSWKLNENSLNRSFISLAVKKVVCHPVSRKQLNCKRQINKQVSAPLSLAGNEKEIIIGIARASLAFYYRETDPFTYASEDDVEVFEMDKGLTIALFGMMKKRRLSLDSYIGFIAFKNGIPVSYGGGWIFGHRCKIGVNIYPPFRGGDSAWLFCQVMRLYYQRYNIHRFVVKPYQFGKGNMEGLRSGAFWFYYKLGFRPVNENIRTMAAEEWDKIKSDRSYRTPISVLKRFTTCNKEWIVNKKSIADPPARDLSIRITNTIRQQFSGDREKAIREGRKALQIALKPADISKLNIEKEIWDNWSLLFITLSGSQKWKKNHSRQWLRLLQLKLQGKERDFILAWQNSKILWL